MSTIHKITPVSHEPVASLADQAYEQLKEAIIAGKLPQGSKLIESELATEYGTSRGPLREAINRLESIRLVVRKPRAGVRVVVLTDVMMEEIYTVREALEGMSARLAAELMSDGEILNLQQLLDTHEAGIHKVHDTAYLQREGDLDFHYRIALASGNQLLLKLLGSELYQLLRMSRTSSAKAPGRPLEALHEHRQIVRAIQQRDGEFAELLMRRHISGAWKIVKKLLQKQAQPTEFERCQPVKNSGR